MTGDPKWNSVSLLMHCDSFTDAVSSTTANNYGGLATIDTGTKKFGSGSIKTAAANSVYFADADKWDFGTGPFTIEFWFNQHTSTGAPQALITHYDDAGDFGDPYWMVRMGSSTFRFEFGGSQSGNCAVSHPIGTWVALCVERDASNKLRFYVDGVMGLSETNTWDITGITGPLLIGSLAPIETSATWDALGYFDEIRITKGAARYASDSGYTVQTAAFPEGLPPPYELADSIITSATPSPGVRFTRSVSDAASYASAATTNSGFPVISSETAALTSSGTYVWQAGATISEAIGVSGSLGVNQILVQLLTQSLGLTDLLVAGRPVSVSDSMTLSSSLTALLGALLADRLNIVETNAPALTYKQTLLEFVRVYDAAAKFLAGVILESVGITPSYVATARIRPTIAETAAISSTISPKLLAIVTESDTINVSDANVLKLIFKPTVREAFSFRIAMVEPNGGFTAWAVNTRTGATTEYQNYEFNSFAQSGHHYLGASSSGLYVLDGDDDDGDPTVATLRSGYAQFGGSRFSSFKAAYLGIRGENDIYLKLEAGTGETYTYQVKLQNEQTTKVRIGKGLRARYFAWELVTTGQDFDLDSVEFIPLVAQRRV